MRRTLPIAIAIVALLTVGCSKQAATVSDQGTSSSASVLRNVIVSTSPASSVPYDVAYPTSTFVMPSSSGSSATSQFSFLSSTGAELSSSSSSHSSYFTTSSASSSSSYRNYFISSSSSSSFSSLSSTPPSSYSSSSCSSVIFTTIPPVAAPPIVTSPTYPVMGVQGAGQIPAWCIRNIGPNGEIILDPSDPAFDCSHGCTPPFSTCAQYEQYQQYPNTQYQYQQYQYPQYQYQQYPNTQYQYQQYQYPQYQYQSPSGQYYPFPAQQNVYGPTSMNDRFLQGLSAPQYAAVSSSSSSSVAGQGSTSSGSSIIAKASGGTHLSLADMLFGGSMACGKGFTLPVLIGGSTPLTACIVDSPWATGSDILKF